MKDNKEKALRSDTSLSKTRFLFLYVHVIFRSLRVHFALTDACACVRHFAIAL